MNTTSLKAPTVGVVSGFHYQCARCRRVTVTEELVAGDATCALDRSPARCWEPCGGALTLCQVALRSGRVIEIAPIQIPHCQRCGRDMEIGTARVCWRCDLLALAFGWGGRRVQS